MKDKNIIYLKKAYAIKILIWKWMMKILVIRKLKRHIHNVHIVLNWNFEEQFYSKKDEFLQYLIFFTNYSFWLHCLILKYFLSVCINIIVDIFSGTTSSKFFGVEFLLVDDAVTWKHMTRLLLPMRLLIGCIVTWKTILTLVLMLQGKLPNRAVGISFCFVYFFFSFWL